MITADIHGAPKLPEGYRYQVHIQHPTHSDPAGIAPLPRPAATVTVTILNDEGWAVSEYREFTRSHLQGAVVAAATHAHEEWQNGE